MANTEPDIRVRCKKCGETWPEVQTPAQEVARQGVILAKHLQLHGRFAALAPKVYLHRVLMVTEAKDAR